MCAAPSPLMRGTPPLVKRTVVPGPSPAMGNFGIANGLGQAAGFLVPLVSDTVRTREEVYSVVDGRRLRLCLLTADDEAGIDDDRPRPGVVFVHGGGWAGGTPAYHMRQAHDLANRGYVCAAIQYRLAPSVQWPSPLDDVRSAIRWMRSQAGELRVDPDRIAVVGGSAGAHLSAMAALTDDAPIDGVSSAVQAAVLLYAPTDLGALERALPEAPPALSALLPGYDEDVLRAVSPITHVHPGAPPILSLIGTRDQALDVAMIDAFHDALAAAGVGSELVVWEDREHGFDFHPQDYAPSFAMIADFLDRTFGVEGSDAALNPGESPALRDPSHALPRRSAVVAPEAVGS